MKLIDSPSSCITGSASRDTKYPSFPMPHVWGHSRKNISAGIEERFADVDYSSHSLGFVPNASYLEAMGYGYEIN